MSSTEVSSASPASGLPPLVLASLLTVYLVWGSTYLAIKFALETFPPFLQMGLRFSCAGVLLLGFALLRGHPLPSGLQWRNALIIGALLLGGGMGFTALAQTRVDSGLTAVFIGCSPLVAALMAGSTGRWPTGREWAGIAMGVVGIAWLSIGGSLAAQPLGVMFLMIAIVTWNLGSLLSVRQLPSAPGVMGFATQMLCGGGLLIVMGLVMQESLKMPTLRSFAAWSYLVIAGSLGAYSAYMYVLPRVRPALAMSYAYVNPIIAVMLGAWLGAEVLTGRDWMASALIVGAVVLLISGNRSAAKDESADH